MLFKALGMVAAITRQLDPDLDVLELLKLRLARTLRERLAPPRLARGASIWGWHLLSVIRQAPSQLREGLRRAASGTWQLQLRHQNIDRLTDELDRSSNRLAFSIVIAAIIVGSLATACYVVRMLEQLFFKERDTSGRSTEGPWPLVVAVVVFAVAVVAIGLGSERIVTMLVQPVLPGGGG